MVCSNYTSDMPHFGLYCAKEKSKNSTQPDNEATHILEDKLFIPYRTQCLHREGVDKSKVSYMQRSAEL